MSRPLALLLSSLLLATSAGAPLAAPPDAPGRFRTASGGEAWRAIAALRYEGRVQASGLEGRFTATEDAVGGRSLTEFTLGPVSGANGFDGRVAWERGTSGEVATLDGDTARRKAVSNAWLVRRGYWRDPPADYREETRVEDGRRYTVAHATPEGGLPVALWFDADTGLLARAVISEPSSTTTLRYSDYRPVAGVQLPHRMESTAGAANNSAVLIVERIVPIAMPEDAVFAAPQRHDRVNPIAGGTTELPFELINNHIYLQAGIDGKPVRLMLDTGGLNLLTRDAARRLGLAPEGEIEARGVGEKTAKVGMARASRLEVGGARMDDPLFYVIDFAEMINVEGIEFDGLVGYELVQRYVTRIDYPGRKVAFIQRDAFTPPAGAVRVPLEFDERTPIAAGAIDGLPARFTIDTGSRSTLSVHAPFAREHGLAERYGARTESVVGWGVGGPSRGVPVRFGTVALGDAQVAGIAGNLSTARSGALSDADLSGNVGSGLLKHFIVTFDYDGRAMYLQPAPTPVAADNHDRLGAWINRTPDGGLEIVAVTPDSAADHAGLAPGDRLIKVNGQQASARTLPEWRALFRDTAPGTPLRLTVRRNGRTLEADATLADPLP